VERVPGQARTLHPRREFAHAAEDRQLAETLFHRVLEIRVEPGCDGPPELEILRRRGELVRWAITMGTGAALLVSLVIGVAFIGFLARMNFSLLVAGLFVAAMGALTLALTFFLREVVLAVGSLEAILPRAVVRSLHGRPDEDDDAPLGRS
jgi:hypothetical protein